MHAKISGLCASKQQLPPDVYAQYAAIFDKYVKVPPPSVAHLREEVAVVLAPYPELLADYDSLAPPGPDTPEGKAMQAQMDLVKGMHAEEMKEFFERGFKEAFKSLKPGENTA
jgi:hypothetical protein